MNGGGEPIISMLEAYARSSTARFHMPGHKGVYGGGMAFERIAPIDITELGFSDDLHRPKGAIAASERAWADACGARGCFFLVNGSTAGVLAMLLSLGTGKRVLIGRDCHRSAIAALALAGHQAIPVFPEAGTDGLGMVSAGAVDQTLTRVPCDAVFITSPNYYGLCADLRAIADAAHRHGALLFVDAAHGAHFPFSSLLPESPAGCADAWVTSAHKTLCAFTQTALLMVSRGSGADEGAIGRALSMIMTSSPSYPLMASLERALSLARGGAWTEHVMRITDVRERIGGFNGLSLLGNERTGGHGISETDLTRLCVRVNGRGISGFDALNSLMEHGVAAEMADLDHVVLITSPNDPNEWYERLARALDAIPLGAEKPFIHHHVYSPRETVLSVREAAFSAMEFVPAERAAGRVAAAAFGIYPPGTALVFPGERIAPEDIAALTAFIGARAGLFGVESNMVACVKENYDI